MSAAVSGSSPPPGWAKGMWLSTSTSAVVLGFVVLPWILMAANGLSIRRGLHAERPAWLRKQPSGAEVRSGVWGDFELIRLVISPTEEILPSGWSKQLTVNWFFPGYTRDSLGRLISSLDLNSAQLAVLLDEAAWVSEEDGVTLQPDGPTILSLPMDVRVSIYSILARSARNPSYNQSWSIRTEDFERALDSADLSPDIREALARVAYTRGRRTLVSDSFTILNATEDRDEKLRITRLLSSAETYLVKLRVPPDADIEKLISYWGGRGRQKDLQPMLESLSSLPDGGSLDIAHLLPAFARQRLYIHPHPVLLRDGIRRDCHWTSLNFFSLVPDDRFGEAEEAQTYISENYIGIGESPRFGDMVFFSLPGGEIIHSCVYLAANLVFTKNGDSILQPWIIMDLDDLSDLYAMTTPDGLDVQYWRSFIGEE